MCVLGARADRARGVSGSRLRRGPKWPYKAMRGLCQAVAALSVLLGIHLVDECGVAILVLDRHELGVESKRQSLLTQLVDVHSEGEPIARERVRGLARQHVAYLGRHVCTRAALGSRGAGARRCGDACACGEANGFGVGMQKLQGARASSKCRIKQLAARSTFTCSIAVHRWSPLPCLEMPKSIRRTCTSDSTCWDTAICTISAPVPAIVWLLTWPAPSRRRFSSFMSR